MWNHTFYWNCLSPKGGGAPSSALGEAINKRWDSFAAFKETFSKSAVGNFGSGWTWLVDAMDKFFHIDPDTLALRSLIHAPKLAIKADVNALKVCASPGARSVRYHTPVISLVFPRSGLHAPYNPIRKTR